MASRSKQSKRAIDDRSLLPPTEKEWEIAVRKHKEKRQPPKDGDADLLKNLKR